MGETEYLQELLFCSVPERIREVCHTCLCASNPWGLSKVLPGGTDKPKEQQHPRECLMPKAASIHSWAGAEQVAQCKNYQEPQLSARSRMYVPVSYTHRQWCHAPVCSSQLKLGRMEMQLLPPTSMHREGTQLILLCTFTPELPLKCFLRWFLSLPLWNVCIEPSKNLLLNLQDKIILKSLHIQHWCREPAKAVQETFSFKYQYCKTSPSPSITKD